MTRMNRIIYTLCCCGLLLASAPQVSAVMPASGVIEQQPAQAAGIILKMRHINAPAVIANAGGHAPLTTQIVAEMKVIAAADLSYKRPASLGTHVLNFDAPKDFNEARAIAEQLQLMDEVEYAIPNLILKPMLTPNDPSFGTQWSLDGAIGDANLPAAWDITTGSNSVVVAVLDTGYTNHADLDGNDYATDGYDFISDTTAAGDGGGRDSDARDEGDYCTTNSSTSDDTSSWHGTAVTSVIRAATNNATFMAGVAWQARILQVRMLGRCGGTTDDLIDAMRWSAGLSVSGVTDNATPAKVINMSLGALALECPTLLQEAANEIHATGTVMIAAAGNENIPAQYSTPANCNHVMSIAAHTQTGNRASFSNYGAVDLSAPGVDMLVASYDSTTTYAAGPGAGDTTSDTYNGTSFAAPMVAGVAALMFARDASINNYYVEQVLRESARDFPSGSSCAGVCGYGMLDAAAAVSMVTTFTPAAQQVEITRDGGGQLNAWFWLGLLLLSMFARKVYQRRAE